MGDQLERMRTSRTASSSADGGGDSPKSFGRRISSSFKRLTHSLSSRSMGSRSNDSHNNSWRSSRRLPCCVDQYALLEELGRGASSTVYRATCKASRREVAVKRIDLDSLNCDLELFVCEAKVMRQMRHANLLPLLSTVLDHDHLWLVTPYAAAGTVADVMTYAYPQGLPLPVVLTIARSVLGALRYLHGNGVVHRDVKSSNIMLDNDGRVYLGDLGAAGLVVRPDPDRPERMARLQRTTFTGTPSYMSPEIVEGVGYDERTDVYSLGVTLVELATGKRPYAAMPMQHALLAILNDDPPELPDDDGVGGEFNPLLRELVRQCLVKDPELRPSAAQLINHPAIRKLARDEQYLAASVIPRLPPADVRARVYAQLALDRLPPGQRAAACKGASSDGSTYTAAMRTPSDGSNASVWERMRAGSSAGGGVASPTAAKAAACRGSDDCQLAVERGSTSWDFRL